MADNFCVMPFVHAFVTPNIISPCCAYTGDLRYNSKEQYWQSEQLQKIQKNMLNNERDPGCVICWKKEVHSKLAILYRFEIGEFV